MYIAPSANGPEWLIGECLGNPVCGAGIRGSIPVLGTASFLHYPPASPCVGHVVLHRLLPAFMTKSVCSWGAIGIGPTSQGEMAPSSDFFHFSPFKNIFFTHYVSFVILVFSFQHLLDHYFSLILYDCMTLCYTCLIFWLPISLFHNDVTS